jgi:hypothetical protein
MSDCAKAETARTLIAPASVVAIRSERALQIMQDETIFSDRRFAVRFHVTFVAGERSRSHDHARRLEFTRRVLAQGASLHCTTQTMSALSAAREVGSRRVDAEAERRSDRAIGGN